MIAFARGGLDRAAQDRDPRIPEHRVERGGELRVTIAEEELHRRDVLVEVHEQVTCHLGHPRVVGMCCDAEDSVPPGRMLDYGEDVGTGAVEQINREEVAGQDRLCLAVEELCPRRPGSTRRGS
jgi:hypothetical protein